MNLRDIKKDIEYLVGEFIDDCSLFMAFNPERGSEDGLAKIIDEAVNLYNDLQDKQNANVTGNKKAYYNGIRKELVEGLDKLCEKLSKEVSK
ncbi:MAG: hypothetical protein MJY55_04105 [Bacteroidales bacterium]|nr:hypothetical protein [Bacteroidales bacterium]